ncbi:SDR family oxidoreductase [Jatrophihabitans telluris]|uniref:SDR family oxidoreductase n=1 Tax=Jatrophihabitans telluris TaxID=2038343 RepID=A0ABY4QTB6_9ACTN|nr:SDR family oxidoreductase [Jatrophihabitans telluris]UQX86959.1 SDR family oxidoreductase [Jatrophihabitans telluris]
MTGTPSAGTAVVTGAASGIGAAAAAELKRRGWSVAGLDLRPAPECDYTAQVDVGDPDAVAAAVAQVQERLGPVDCAVSVAGYYEMLPVSDITEQQWTRMLRVHVGGLVNLSRAVLTGMLERGTGSIVAVASELAVGGGSEDAHYAAAKGAILGVVRSLSAEVAGRGVRVNAVAPGPTDTPLLAADSPWRAPDYLRTLPLGRLVSAEEVALCIAFLADEATFCVGEVLNPNAGAVI